MFKKSSQAAHENFNFFHFIVWKFFGLIFALIFQTKMDDEPDTRESNSSDDRSEEPNTKKLKMADLLKFKPKAENDLRKKWDERRKEIKAKEANAGDQTQAPSGSAKPAVAAPRVKLNDNGEMVIDADSLVIVERPDDNNWTTVNDISSSSLFFNGQAFRISCRRS
jgi:hypothetical protein